MLSFAGLTFSSPFVLAPLAGYTDLPFRLLCKEYGAGYCVSEMISCHGLTFRQEKTLSMLQSVAEEKPVAFQLFGAEPDVMGEAAAIMSEHQPDIIDLNMGCPVRKVTKRGAGAALMSTVDIAEEIIRQVKANSTVPITVKFRSGPDSEHINAVEFGQMAAQAGASALVVHGRTRSQGFTGFADRTVIARVKEAVSIPVIGNGDILCYQDGLDMMAETGCDGVMVGRGALGNPWVFSPEGRPEDSRLIIAGAIRHMELMKEFLPVDRMIGCIKNHLGRYFRGLHGSSRIRKAVYDSPTFLDLHKMLLSFTTE
jgi:nifR3 family TIM-barrel protein